MIRIDTYLKLRLERVWSFFFCKKITWENLSIMSSKLSISILFAFGCVFKCFWRCRKKLHKIKIVEKSFPNELGENWYRTRVYWSSMGNVREKSNWVTSNAHKKSFSTYESHRHAPVEHRKFNISFFTAQFTREITQLERWPRPAPSKRWRREVKKNRKLTWKNLVSAWEDRDFLVANRESRNYLVFAVKHSHTVAVRAAREVRCKIYLQRHWAVHYSHMYDPSYIHLKFSSGSVEDDYK